MQNHLLTLRTFLPASPDAHAVARGQNQVTKAFQAHVLLGWERKEARKASAFIQDKTRSLAHTWLKTELGEEAASSVGALTGCVFQAEKGVRSPPPVTRNPPMQTWCECPKQSHPLQRLHMSPKHKPHKVPESLLNRGVGCF